PHLQRTRPGRPAPVRPAGCLLRPCRRLPIAGPHEQRTRDVSPRDERSGQRPGRGFLPWPWRPHARPILFREDGCRPRRSVPSTDLNVNDGRDMMAGLGQVLVTGGAGAIGSRLVKRLLDDGAERVVVVDDLSSGYDWLLPKDPRVELVRKDVCELLD